MYLMHHLRLSLKWIFVSISITLFFTNCSNDKKSSDLQAAVSSFIEGNKKVTAFGHVSVQTILDKADYKHIPKVGAILSAELPTWKSGMDIEQPIYFALESELGSTNPTVYGFMAVKNKDSLANKLSSMGYTLEKKGDMSYFQEGDVATGIKGDLLIFVTKSGEYDGKATLTKAFESTKGDASGEKVTEILTDKSDIAMGISFERTYDIGNPALKNMSAENKTLISTMIKDGYSMNTINFENGALKMVSKNMFSDQMKDMFFKTTGSNDITSKLGSGKAWMGLSVNFDLKNLEKWFNTFAPDAQRNFNQLVPDDIGIALALLGDEPFSKLITGKFGIAATGNPKGFSDLSYNGFLGLGPQGSVVQKYAEKYAKEKGMIKAGDNYVVNGNFVSIKKDGITVYNKADAKGKSIQLPSFAKDFGSNNFDFFIDMKNIDINNFELPLGTGVVGLIEHVIGYGNRDGGAFVIQLKDKNTNVLKQIAKYYTKLGEETMGGGLDM